MAAQQRRWGWHELDDRWAERLVADARIERGDTVLDIGAGTGAITAPLLERGARVIAVEAHPKRAQALRDRFGRAIVVVQADAADLRLPRRPFHVVANPPFAVTTPMLRRLLQPGSRLVSARLVLQDQAARRWGGDAAPGARRWSQTFATVLESTMPRHAFRPPPRVPVRVLQVERRPGA
ncbi:MAG TPA: rRNA adenine N-6-methyltransferase family protein [Acidimicrobiales bacterium]